MELIYTRDNLQLFVDTTGMSACIVRGTTRIMLDLEPLVPLSPLEAKNIRLLGQNPADFLHIGHSCHIIPREAAASWEEALKNARQRQRALDTSMIPLFRRHLPGLPEVRETEDLLESMASNITMYTDSSESIVSSRAAEICRRFPRETLYVKAERMAMSNQEHLAALARRILTTLICGKELSPEYRQLLDEREFAPPRPSRTATVPQ